MIEKTIVDDGSLAFLNIPRNANSRSFNCAETTQSKLVNTTFWIIDYITDVPTKQLIAPYLGWTKHSDSKHLLTKIINKKYYASILR